MATVPDTEVDQPQAPAAPRPNPWVPDLPRYTPGKREVPATPTPIKLSSNESSFGPSPRAVEAYHAAADLLNRYPDASQTPLRAALAEVHGIDAARIVCGNGSDELLDLLIRSYLGVKDELILSENHFEMSSLHARAHGASVVLAPERSFRMDVDAVIRRVTERTRMVILANPNNPTGTYLPAREIARLQGALPPQVLLVIDGAYAEYVTAPDYDAGLKLVDAACNVVTTRTFSKIYGLSALRIGWAYCPAAVADVLERVRSPFNVNGAAMAAATAAVMDQDHIAAIRRQNAEWLQRIGKALSRPHVEVIPSAANFFLLHFLPGGTHSAAAAAAHLESRGIIPRAVNTGKSAHVLRITVGMDHENEAMLEALGEYLG